MHRTVQEPEFLQTKSKFVQFHTGTLIATASNETGVDKNGEKIRRFSTNKLFCFGDRHVAPLIRHS